MDYTQYPNRVPQPERDPLKAIARDRIMLIESILIEVIEKIEGRVPSNEEIDEHAQMIPHENGVRSITWKGKLILREKQSVQDGKIISEFEKLEVKDEDKI